MTKKAQFFGTRHTKIRKDQTCFGTGKTIKAGTYTRHDVWKEWDKMVSKYYCQECEYLFDTQYTLRLYGQPFNPMKGQIIQMFPQFFQRHFEKYDMEKRIIVLADLRQFFEKSLIFGFVKYFFASLFKKTSYSFDKEDLREFATTYEHTKAYWHFITKDTR